MKCFVELDVTADIIELPDEIALKIKKYSNQFLDWLYDKKNKHKYWIKSKDRSGNEFVGVCYDTDAFVQWLNEKKIKNKFPKAEIVERDLSIDSCPEGMLRIFF